MEIAFAEKRKKGSDQEQFLFLKLTSKLRFLRSWTREIIFGSFKSIWSPERCYGEGGGRGVHVWERM